MFFTKLETQGLSNFIKSFILNSNVKQQSMRRFNDCKIVSEEVCYLERFLGKHVYCIAYLFDTQHRLSILSDYPHFSTPKYFGRVIPQASFLPNIW